MKKRNILIRARLVLCCLMLAGVLLLVSACSDSSGPGSQPSNRNGYSIIQLVTQEVHFFQAFFQR